jgi:predicted nucleic acid-binding protein
MRRAYLLDTNHLSAAIRAVSPLRDEVRRAGRSGCRFFTCWPVLCELEDGIVQTADPKGYRRTLSSLIKEVRIWSIDWKVVRRFGELSQRLRRIGRKLSLADVTLAAMALNKHVTILTSDLDFSALPEIQTENWIP